MPDADFIQQQWRDYLNLQVNARWDALAGQWYIPPVNPAPEGDAMVVNTFKVGCDPEFVVLDPPEALINVQGKLPRGGPVGWDHNGRVAELRPEPSRQAWLVVQRLQKLVKADPHVEPLRKYKWQAGALVHHEDGMDTLGGHVHIDVPFGSPEAGLMIPALDKFTEWCERLDILPQKDSAARREYVHPHIGQEYGKFGDVRESGGHLEYRTMASWLFDPKVALVCLTGAKLAAKYARDAYRVFTERKPSLGVLHSWFGGYAPRDTDAYKVADVLRQAIALDTQADIKQVWSELKGLE